MGNRGNNGDTMTMDHLDTKDGLFTLLWQPALSDFECVRYLKRLIEAITLRLESLRRDAGLKGDPIAIEEAILASAQKELKALEARFFMV
jgi:hypothetical protein